MQNKAINALLELEIPANLKGFGYIVDAMEAMDGDEKLRHGSVMEIYTAVAERNETNAVRVERAIRHAFGVALTSGNIEAVTHYLSRKNTSNGNLLNILYLRLSQEED